MNAENISVMPTERLREIIEAYHRYADALIEIATAFYMDSPGDPAASCSYCLVEMEEGCGGDCPGLLARRALGVA